MRKEKEKEVGNELTVKAQADSEDNLCDLVWQVIPEPLGSDKDCSVILRL